MLGEALEATGGADQSIISELGRIVSQQPQNAVAVSMLARAQTRAGKFDEAVATLRAGLGAVRLGSDREKLNLQLQLAQKEAKLAYKNVVIAVLMEEIVRSKKANGEL
jgi:cytochrome c-type biogenesis protein CcmH/NrfG